MAAAVFFVISPAAYSSNAAMKGPPASNAHGRTARSSSGTSAFELPLKAAIKFYRTFASPTQGPRCDFIPSCSTFGLIAIRECGPIRGAIMTTDRLTRCNILKHQGPDYYLLPDGKLFDPVSNNLLKEP